jgi:CRISPR-associated protein Cas5h
VGAIMGFKKDEYLENTKHLKIGIKIENPVKKTRMGINLIFTKGTSGFDPTLSSKKQALRTQVKFEFLKDVCYKIYISSEPNEDDLLKHLQNRLLNHQTFYTISLGLSELLADFSFEGVYEAVEEKEVSMVHSVIPVSAVKSLDLEKAKYIAKERIPTFMLPSRQVQKYEDVIFDIYGSPLYGKFNNIIKLENNEHIYLW